MGTTNLRCSTLLARLHDRGLTVDDFGEFVTMGDSHARVIHISDDRGRYTEAVIIEHDNGCYDLYVQQQSPLIDDDAEFILATMRDYGCLPFNQHA